MKGVVLFIYMLLSGVILAFQAHGASGFMASVLWRLAAARRWHALYSAYTDEAAELLIAGEDSLNTHCLLGKSRESTSVNTGTPTASQKPFTSHVPARIWWNERNIFSTNLKMCGRHYIYWNWWSEIENLLTEGWCVHWSVFGGCHRLSWTATGLPLRSCRYSLNYSYWITITM